MGKKKLNQKNRVGQAEDMIVNLEFFNVNPSSVFDPDSIIAPRKSNVCSTFFNNIFAKAVIKKKKKVQKYLELNFMQLEIIKWNQ